MEAFCAIEIEGKNYYVELEYLKHRFFKKSDVSKFHVQQSYHMILISKGANQLLLKDSPPVEAKTNSLIFINPFVPHQFLADPETGVEHTCIIWSFKDKEGNYARFPLQQLVTKDEKMHKPYLVCQLSDIEAAQFIEREREAEKYVKSANFFSASMIFFELWFLGLRLVLKDEVKFVEGIKTGHSLVEKIKSFIEWELRNPELCIKMLADSLNMHPNYVNSIFKKQTGITIGNYIRNKRIDLAKVYLIQDIYPISEIAELCGFNQHSYFTRTFKKVCGVSPNLFKNQPKT